MGTSSKKKVQVWKRALLHFLLCFLVGVLTGLTPFNAMIFSTNLSYNKPKTRREFAIEVKSIPTNAQQDFSQVGNRGRLIETIRIEGSEARMESEERENERNSTETDLYSVLSTRARPLDFVPRKLLIIVTPTYNHPFQALYLNRLAHTLGLVPPPLLWIVVEMPTQSMETAQILRKTGVMYRHLVCDKNLTEVKDRSVHQRNVALGHIEQHQLDGIVYFADDNNVYTLELFEQLREIKRFGTWPVSWIAHNKKKAFLEGPVCNSTKVIGWHTNERKKRVCRFHLSMLGFAFNSTILWDPLKWGRPTVEHIRQLDTGKDGVQETQFVEQVVEDESQMEGLADGCSKIMVWNLHLEASGLAYPSGWSVEKLNASLPLRKHK
ncbi:probable beta-1,4-xylosyltransferase IRX9H [Cryptomeria japonica]|uniref:probable beta-1,4-xylosyltransferase IRX9H n=1 Tax=Cryptomeria japonica TaxID=3369 RepID=UPI0027DA69ED|nr:probable beta-1,4-xylosyltransferase IRX9H [Cryptomeria japonica]